MESPEAIFKRMQKNRKFNSWWLKLFIKLNGPQWLTKKGLTPQAIGVWLNPYTSNGERFQIIRTATRLKKS